ncbi:malonyl-coenzyme:anthocyanin 5-O-glucoside-6'''-O-malonyltransferase-like [Primulina tabacum]|uniref:malonyl-coenzyme:anthocyanin 5-O-glucoside-6'''-O-malonyltransferase-like n=1 Tax=Primulina tabacum TaxID=48773 RepID=UPI003F5AA677
MTSLVETCRISPPQGEVPPEVSFPATYFDIVWIAYHPIRRLIFFDYTESKSSFFETHLPNLKRSLSLTLKHFTPLAGNIIHPLNTTEKPRFRYVEGDSVSLTVSESSNDFDSLVSYGARDADQFYDYVPQMPPLKDEPEHKLVPILALQVTLFPGKGICIGFTNHHSIGDASSIVSFIKTWASICKFDGSDEELMSQDYRKHKPCFDRKLIKDPLGIDAIFWNKMRQIPIQSSTFPLPTERVRATFILDESDIRKLKDLVLSKRPSAFHLSSFVIASSYVWVNLVKSGVVIGEEVDANVDEYFIFAADARARTDPPVPTNYFGNCLCGGMVKVAHGELVGNEGVAAAAEATAGVIRNKVNNKAEALKGAENWLSDFENLGEIRTLGVSGSPKFDLYRVDYGLGKARKVEVVSLDGEKYSMSLCKWRDSETGLEVGLSLPKPRMEAFAALFQNGLRLISPT